MNYLQIAIGVAIGACVSYAPAYIHGKSVAKSQIQAEAAKEALDRITELEENNATFKALPDRDRCIVFMRDSQLPISACD